MLTLKADADWDAARATSLAVVYKHSSACPVSAQTLHQIRRFQERRPDVPVYAVDVLADRDVSNRIAGDLGIVHQSPQAIVLRRGNPAWSASHGGITASRLERAACVAAYEGDPDKLREVCGDEPKLSFLPVPRIVWVLMAAGLALLILRAPDGGRALLIIAGLAAVIHLIGNWRKARDRPSIRQAGEEDSV